MPSTTEPVAVRKAICRLSQKPEMISVSVVSAWYQRSVKPRQTLGSGESLNE